MGWINLKNGDQSDASQINGIANELTSHETDKLNPHVVTKNQVGLPNVDNTSDMNKPISTLVKSALDGKAENSHNHQTSDILYFDAEVSNNVDVSANTNSRHTHTNSSILNSITDAIIVNWNTAYNHISDVVKHITGSERSLWNTVSNKVDKVTGKQLSTEDFSTVEKTKLTGIANGANNYTHPATHTSSMITGLASVATSGNYIDLTGNPTTLPANGGNSTTVNGHTVNSDVPVNAKFTDMDTITTINGKTGGITKADVVALGIPAQDTVYTHPITHPPSIIVQDATHRFVADTEKTTWNSKETTSGSQAKANTAENNAKLYADTIKPTKTSQLVNDSTYVTISELGNAGYGDMLKATYDTNGNGKVDTSESADSVPWNGVTGKPSAFNPSVHNHTKSQITDFPILSTVATSGKYTDLTGKPTIPNSEDFAPAIVNSINSKKYKIGLDGNGMFLEEL